MIPALPLIFKYWRVGVVVAAFVAGCVVTNWYWEAGEARALRRGIEHAAQKSTGLEIQLELLQRKERATNRSYANETRKDTYRCPFPADGDWVLNDARTAGKHAR